MNNFAICYINGIKTQILPEHAFMTLAQFLRYQRGLTGTKIVCSEGDCGACSVLISEYREGKMQAPYTVNSCIRFMFQTHQTHIVSVEGLQSKDTLHEVQAKIMEQHATQCGYCTPGIVCSLAELYEKLKKSKAVLTEQKIKNYLTGNLCRCTGYQAIIKAAQEIDFSTPSIEFQSKEMVSTFKQLDGQALLLEHNDQEVFLPYTSEELINYKTQNCDARIISGATDIAVLVNKQILDLSKVLYTRHLMGADKITHSADSVMIGCNVSLAQIEKELSVDFPEFSRLMHIFASPQIKNVATLVGNLINASPIGDTIPFLLVAQAQIELIGAKGTRVVLIDDFIKPGYKELDLKDNEFVSKIILPKSDHQYKIYKVSPRKDLDITCVSFASRYRLDGHRISDISFSFGGVGPRALKLEELSKMAIGASFERKTFKDLSSEVINLVKPITDHRGSDQYRLKLCQNLLLKMHDEVSKEQGLGLSEASV